MSFWQAVTWETARASGMVAYLLITLSVAVGLALTQQIQSARWPRMLNTEMHNFLALVGLVFIGVHVVAVLVDPFTHFGISAVLVPFISTYRPVWMGLGIVSLYLGFAILISTWLRPRIGYAWWRRIHVLTLLGYIGVTLHGIGSGTDTRTWWAALIYVASVAGIGALLIMRLLIPATARAKRHPVIAGLVGLGIAALAVWAIAGPAQADWGTHASGIALAATTIQGNTTAANTTDPYAQGFADTFTGTLAQSAPDGAGNVTLTLTMHLGTLSTNTVGVNLQAQQTANGLGINAGTVVLATDANAHLYQGDITAISGDRTWHITATVSHGKTQLHVTITLVLQSNSTISGSVSGSTAN
ncbi:MAG: ferric reductase-like transmembrane domain-containing protein [Ktedonobacterales bacterium]|nr:ferric reductase-like transmembrane domain-containing protein [Ktedonobacterales bacterium]